MVKITQKTKSELFTALKNESNSFGEYNEDGILGFLSDIWDLGSMPSEDIRFNNAYSDIYQHTVNNDDWSIDYLFLNRLKLLDDDAIFIKFLETVASIKYRESEDDVIKFVLLINSYLEKEKLNLVVSDYSEDNIPIFTLQVHNENELNDLPKNKITFYVDKYPSGRSDSFSSHKSPNMIPCFILVFNEGWNDFGVSTEFSLFYYKSINEKYYIGKTKITNGGDEPIRNQIPIEFNLLSDEYCSLGQNIDYYKNLKNHLGKYFESVLYALKDAAFFPDVHDKFQNNKIFKSSLIRYNSAERTLRQAKHELYGYDLSNLYSFKYSFTPKYSKDVVDIEFDFNNNSDIPDRIFAIIGKNGIGKTQLITTLPLDISKKNDDRFVPRSPLFSKVIAVSYSIFDNFVIPNRTSSFNYVYCGLHNNKGDGKETMSLKQLSLRFHTTWKNIKKQGRMGKWRNILSNFIDIEVLNTFIENDVNDSNSLTVNVAEFNKAKEKLSSGQSIILFIMSEIISNIRLDSLILFDEPETHLHPNAVSQLMNTIYDLVNEFESYCILATHSPLVIQELLSKNVYVFERHENLPTIRKISIESFGENLSIITEEVFGNREVEKQYKKILDNLIRNRLSYNEILDKLESDNISLSLNARLYIKSRLG